MCSLNHPFAELNLKLEEERAEVKRLKEEESSWLERGIHAEFEKKDEVSTCVCDMLQQ